MLLAILVNANNPVLMGLLIPLFLGKAVESPDILHQFLFTNESLFSHLCSYNIGKIAEKGTVQDQISNLRIKCPFLPSDLINCASQETYGTDEGKEFLAKHARIGRHKVEIFRLRDTCSCPWCASIPKSSARAKGHAPHRVKINKDEYSKFTSPAPLGSDIIESDCPSMVESKRTGRCFIQLNSLNKSAVLGFAICMLCGKFRCLHGSKRNAPKAKIKWLITVCSPAYQCQCGQPLCPQNDINRVVLPCADWHDERCRVEVRHNLFCSTPIESQASINHFINECDLAFMCS